ncbi:MAG TPA: transposase family protein [Anaerolineae bacterium]|nr:transposase family protein [Anaerolineae bacterium]
MVKKAHTVTNNIITHPASRTVCYLSQTYPGTCHDKRICDEEGYIFPRNAQLLQDTGFQGYAPQDVISYQPKKKPRGGELDCCERFINTVIATARVTVENIICGIKRCRILKDTFRNHLPGFDDLVIEIACGLHNLRVRYRHPTEHFDLFEFVA